MPRPPVAAVKSPEHCNLGRTQVSVLFMSMIITFIILVVFWIFMSGLLDPWHFGLGLLSCALVSYMSHDLLFPGFAARSCGPNLLNTGASYNTFPGCSTRSSSPMSTWSTALSPRMQDKIYPHVVNSRLKNELALVVFADSITSPREPSARPAGK